MTHKGLKSYLRTIAFIAAVAFFNGCATLRN